MQTETEKHWSRMYGEVAEGHGNGHEEVFRLSSNTGNVIGDAPLCLIHIETGR